MSPAEDAAIGIEQRADKTATGAAERALRADLAAALQWTARSDLHEGVANHFSVKIGDGARFLINPNQRHFSRIRASDLLALDADGPAPEGPDAPDPTAWGLHGAIHREIPRATCLMHLHPPYSTALACLEDPRLPPLDQSAAMFYGRTAIDQDYGGLALDDEGARCATMLADPAVSMLIMGNHGVLAVGDSVADAWNKIYYFERAARTYVLALQTGRPLKVLSPEIASKTSEEINSYPEGATRHFDEIKAILDAAGSNYAE